MVQFFQIQPKRRSRIAEQLGKSLGAGLSEFMGNYMANKDLEGVLNDKSLANAPPSERISALESALRPHGERGMHMLQNRMAIEQKREQEQQEVRMRKASKQLAKQFGLKGEEFEGMSPQEIIKYGQTKKETQNTERLGENIKQSLVKAGYPEDTADVWKQQFLSAPTGGQTDVIRQVNDLLKRSPKGKGFQGPQDTSKPSIEIPGIETTKFDLDFPEIPAPMNLTPADMVRQQEGREKVLAPLYAETIDTLNALDEDHRDLIHMQELNESKKLPEGLSKWNVNWETGDLRIPALATPEAQDYVKTVYRMLGHAKDFFPGRVTNFDLESFKKRFPTLANSPEGRRIIAKELEVANRIAYLREETLKSAIEHYGSQADPVMVRKAANDNYRRLKGQLENELKTISKEADAMANKGEAPKRINVYDSSGKLVGDIDESEISQLPQGYTTK